MKEEILDNPRTVILDEYEEFSRYKKRTRWEKEREQEGYKKTNKEDALENNNPCRRQELP